MRKILEKQNCSSDIILVIGSEYGTNNIPEQKPSLLTFLEVILFLLCKELCDKYLFGTKTKKYFYV